jgi:hypothetical protein
MTGRQRYYGQYMYLSFLLLGVIAFSVVLYFINIQQNKSNRILKQNQIQSCLRGAITRKAANNNSLILSQFLLTAVNIRLRVAKVTTGEEHQANLDAAMAWEKLAKKVKLVPLVDCSKIVK